MTMICALRAARQTESPLFSKLPGEIRNIIYHFALADYEDPNEAYDGNTCYRRPGYFAQPRTDTALLRTCQTVHEEAWFIPWTSRLHTLFFTDDNRKPHSHTTLEEMQTTLEKIHSYHGDQATAMKHVRVFPQLWALENGVMLQDLLDIEFFNPKCITITIRHTDWWWWEDDQILRIDSMFVNHCRFPNSVLEVRMELESIARRRAQVQDVAKQMRDRWLFRRQDGKLLTVRGEDGDRVMRWEGSSTWNGERWLRDETKPDTLEYYVQTVRFRTTCDLSPDSEAHSSPPLIARGHVQITSPDPFIRVVELEERGIGPGFTASEVRALLAKYVRRCVHSVKEQRCCGSGLGAGWASSKSQSTHCQNCQDGSCIGPDEK